MHGLLVWSLRIPGAGVTESTFTPQAKLILNLHQDSLCVANYVNFVKFIITSVKHFNIIQKRFIALQVLLYVMLTHLPTTETLRILDIL